MLNLSNHSLLRKSSYIDGTWLGASESKIAVNNPYNNELICNVSEANDDDVHQAIESAQNAFKTWSTETAAHRAEILEKWHDLILANIDDLALILTTEQGKPLAEAKGEIKYGASFIKWFAEEGKRAYGDIIPSPWKERRVFALKQPIGVVAAITPWNFPTAMITRKVGPALAAGCSIIVKPSEETPLSALALAHLAEEAGLPKGVLNVVVSNDAKTVGEQLCNSSVVRKVSFTGSTEVGKLLMKQSSNTVKKVSLELGGNAPFLVFKDANINEAVNGAVASKYRNSGQTCVCANRLLVHEVVYEEFVAAYVAEVEKLPVGNGLDSDAKIGPLINKAAIEKVNDLIEDALAKGAQVATGGKLLQENSTLFSPTVLTGIQQNMRCTSEEIFGPVAPIQSFKTENEALTLANDTQYGLASYFYARDMGTIWRIAEGLEYGMVGINEGVISTEVAPFGGVKESGIGREGSKYGLDEFMELKYLCMGGLKSQNT